MMNRQQEAHSIPLALPPLRSKASPGIGCEEQERLEEQDGYSDRDEQEY